ncbi:MAG: hypothetical protein PHD48_03835 [Alphaproteobacteria bacterium]|nr:hypothetical protein [Alphaproteobacteria bacterium]
MSSSNPAMRAPQTAHGHKDYFPTVITFARLGALVRGLPRITLDAQNEHDKQGTDFHTAFHNTFHKKRDTVVFRKDAESVLSHFAQSGIPTHIMTCLPDEKAITPVLEHINQLTAKNGSIKRFTLSDFFFSGEQQDIHLGYKDMIREIRITQNIQDQSERSAPVIALMFGYEQADALLSIEASKFVFNKKTFSLVLPFIHAREHYKAPKSSPPIHLEQTMSPIDPCNLIIKSQCLNTKVLSSCETAERYFESRDLNLLAETALRLAGTLGRMKSLDSFPCN